MCSSTMAVGIESSIWPLIIWLRVLGFHMGETRSGNDRRYSIWLLITGVVIVLSTVALHSTSFVRGVIRLSSNEIEHNSSTNFTRAHFINIGIEHLNFTFTLIGVHSSFFLITLTRGWKTLWNTLELIEVRLNFQSTFYDKCRKSLFIGFVLLSADGVTYFVMSICSPYGNLGAMSPLALVFSNILRTVLLSIYLLFGVIVRVVTLVFQELNERISPEQFHPFYSTRILHDRLEKWRRNHTIACELVELVNKCYGIMFLISTTNIFVSFVTTSFEIVHSMQNKGTSPILFLFIYILLKKFILLIILVYEPYCLQAEAARTAVFLRRLQSLPSNLLIQTKLNTIIVEVNHACPKITAMEFFDVNLRLLPSLIGGTLTYVAILYQTSRT